MTTTEAIQKIKVAKLAWESGHGIPAGPGNMPEIVTLAICGYRLPGPYEYVPQTTEFPNEELATLAASFSPGSSVTTGARHYAHTNYPGPRTDREVLVVWADDQPWNLSRAGLPEHEEHEE